MQIVASKFSLLMKKFFVSALLLTSITGSAEPLADSVAMTVGSKPISMAEFLYMAQKNGANNNLSEEKNLKDFVELFQNFKLKVIEAEAEGLDKAPSYKSELERYRSELISGYLSDKKAEDLVVEKEHERLKEFLGFDHLIFFLPAKCVSKDTVAVYQQAMEAYERISNGESFEAVGKDLMQKYPDKAGYESVHSLSPMKTVKGFEDRVYGMKEGELAKPFRSQLGFHVVRMKKRIPNPGRVQVAHILIPFQKDSITQTEEEVKKEAERIYNLVKNGADFSETAKQYSSDKASALRGGVLPLFGLGEMVEPFEKQAFALTNPGDISEPFKTQFGYHIVKLLGKQGMPTVEEVANSWRRKMSQGEWNFTLHKGFDDYLKEAYHYTPYPEAYAELQSLCNDYFPSDNSFFEKAQSMDKPLVRIDTVQFAQNEFAAYMIQAPFSTKNYSGDFMKEVYDLFVREIMTSMEKKNLLAKHPDIPLLLNEYRDGILLFSISNEKIWNKPAGEQKAAEEAWIEELKVKYPVVVNWKAIKKAVKR